MLIGHWLTDGQCPNLRFGPALNEPLRNKEHSMVQWPSSTRRAKSTTCLTTCCWPQWCRSYKIVFKTQLKPRGIKIRLTVTSYRHVHLNTVDPLKNADWKKCEFLARALNAWINKCDLRKGSIFFLTDSSLKIEGYTLSSVSVGATVWSQSGLHSEKRVPKLFLDIGTMTTDSVPHPLVQNLCNFVIGKNHSIIILLLPCYDKNHWCCDGVGSWLLHYFSPLTITTYYMYLS